MTEQKHIVSFSGGADSTAVAILLKERGIDFELLFADTGAEFPETIYHITRVAKALEVPLRVVTGGSFYHGLVNRKWFIPCLQVRWCTKELKVLPLIKQTEGHIEYIGFRAEEEHRQLSEKNCQGREVKYPLIEAGLDKKAVIELCKKHDILNPLYCWRTNVSCFCCPFQRKADWKGLLKNHPELYALVEQWEQRSEEILLERGNKAWTWGGSKWTLRELRLADESQMKLFPEPEGEACLICTT